MTDPSSTAKGRTLDVLIYGTALALAIIGAIAAFADFRAGEEAQRIAEPSERARAPELQDAPERAAERAVDERIVPDLPEVPDLATEPPPVPAGSDDPRLAQLGAEMRFLGHARELFEASPEEALAVLEQHRRAHSDGILREEREALAIEALVLLDQRGAAERRYYDFLRVYPGSDLRSRLEALMR